MFYWLVWLLLYLPLRIFCPLKIIGKNNIPKKQKVILSCNHSSNLDPILIDSHFIKRPYILAKHTLFKNKLVGAVLKSWGAIPVNRENVEISTIKTVLNVLKQDKMLLIFPQGRREKDLADMQGAKNGLAMFALKTNSPIVPMWYVKKPRFFRCNTLLIGKPFYLEGFEGQKLTQEVLTNASNIIIQKMYELRDNYLKEQEQKKQAKLAKKNKIKTP